MNKMIKNQINLNIFVMKKYRVQKYVFEMFKALQKIWGSQKNWLSRQCYVIQFTWWGVTASYVKTSLLRFLTKEQRKTSQKRPK